ncbi:hypothetical protein ACJ72_08820, partial [Emergomyces africanus]
MDGGTGPPQARSDPVQPVKPSKLARQELDMQYLFSSGTGFISSTAISSVKSFLQMLLGDSC